MRNIRMENKAKHEGIFTQLYEENFWGGTTSPKSGTGSTKTAALPYVQSVKNFIETKSINTVLDIGHGDWEMWGEYQFSDVNYTGIDVYESLSKNLAERFGNQNRSFKNINAVLEELPPADLVITKDVLQHLPLSDIEIILNKLGRYKYLIICNDFYKISFGDTVLALRRFISLRERIRKIKSMQNPAFLKLKKTNCDIEIGEHRCLDFEKKTLEKKLLNHKLLYKIDFIGKDVKRPNVVKRIYFYEKS